MAVMLCEWVFTSTFLIIVVLALRAALGKRMSAGVRYALWAVVLVRLLVPVQLFTSPVAGTWVLAETRAEKTVYTPAVSAPGEAAGEPAIVELVPEGVAVNYNTIPAPTAPAAPKAPEAPDLSNPPAWLVNLGWVWLAGSAAVVFVLLLSNLRFFWRLRRERIPLDEADLPLRVYVAVGLPSPCLFGLVRPAIYITPEAAANPDMLRHVLAHEYTHFRHGDHLWSLLRCAALAAHWWNPLAWVSAVLSQRDGELACDEGALKRLGDGERAAYGGTLLALVTAKPRPGDLFRCATTMAGDKKSLKERISRIAKAPQRVLWAVVVAVLVTALACVCAFGQAEEPEEVHEYIEVGELTAELSFSDGEDDYQPRIRIEGSVGGYTMKWGATFYCPIESRPDFPLGEIKIWHPLEDSYVIPWSEAWWTDESRTSVRVQVGTYNDPSAPRDDSVIFTVRLSGQGGTVMEKSGQIPELPPDAPPRDITDEEAVKLACISAKLLAAVDEYYGMTAQPKNPEDWNDLPAHFTADVSKVPEDVVQFVGESARESCANIRTYWGDNHISGPVVIDGWRVNTLNGPWTGTAWGMDLEVWQFNYEAHTTTPEKAASFIDGDGYLDNDGWLRNIARDSDYAIFRVSGDGTRTPFITYSDSTVSPANDEDAFFAWVSGLLEQKGITHPLDFPQTDLNRNGVPETLRVYMTDGGMGQRLEVVENGEVIYTEEGYYAHVGYNALFLCTLDGEDCLLRYSPYMGQGWCTYSYQLFTLENGRETVVQENSLDFDVNFVPFMHESFEPEAIAAFMDEVNGLLAHSVQLLNTDGDLLPTFEKEGRLYDSLGWLDSWEGAFTRDESKSLVENLRAYQEAMESQWYAAEPVVFCRDELGQDVRLCYHDKEVRVDAQLDILHSPSTIYPDVLDLNGDGRDEIVFPLLWGSGLGASVDQLCVFDADTLEQYVTSGLNDMILNSIQSTGDEDYFYLKGPGMAEPVQLDKRAPSYNPDGPVADAIELGNIIQYTVSDGAVSCWLGCDTSGMLIGYEGYLKVTLEFTKAGGFQCVNSGYLEKIEY